MKHKKRTMSETGMKRKQKNPVCVLNNWLRNLKEGNISIDEDEPNETQKMLIKNGRQGRSRMDENHPEYLVKKKIIGNNLKNLRKEVIQVKNEAILSENPKYKKIKRFTYKLDQHKRY